jgi:hypothetical protein
VALAHGSDRRHATKPTTDNDTKTSESSSPTYDPTFKSATIAPASDRTAQDRYTVERIE